MTDEKIRELLRNKPAFPPPTKKEEERYIEKMLEKDNEIPPTNKILC